MTARDYELEAPQWQRLEATLLATARAIRRAYRVRLKAFDLNLNQASMLGVLNLDGPMTQTQLARILGMSRAAAGSVIDELEGRSLIERRAHPDDRRAWLIALRPEGEALTKPIADVAAGLRRDIRAGIPRAEREQLAESLVRLHSNLADILAEEKG
jgi:DNA-binding MarR family transcriptional regulator